MKTKPSIIETVFYAQLAALAYWVRDEDRYIIMIVILLAVLMELIFMLMDE